MHCRGQTRGWAVPEDGAAWELLPGRFPGICTDRTVRVSHTTKAERGNSQALELQDNKPQLCRQQEG